MTNKPINLDEIIEQQFPNSEDLPPSSRQNGMIVYSPPMLDDDQPDLSHDALALAISRAGWTHNARYVHAWGKWAAWDGSKWVIDEMLHHYTGMRGFLRSVANELVQRAERKAELLQDVEKREKIMSHARGAAKVLGSAATVSSVEAVARSNPDLVASPGQFDADINFLGTPGGAVDLSTGEILPADRRHYITKHTAVTPAPAGARAPLWLSFLDRVFNRDRELIRFVQIITGYALTGSTREHKLFFLFGTGSNGKSVFLNAIYDIAGDYARRAPAATFLDSVGERHTTDLAGLRGARLVAGSELPAGKSWNEAIIKDLTGGDTITARFMRQDFFEYIPQFTLLIAGNHQPSFRGIDEAIRRRVVLIPFTETISADERDPELPEKLEAEWPAILRWMIDGAVVWHKEGLRVPDSVSAASTDYLDAEDSMGEFIADHLQKQPGGSTPTSEIYTRFCAWQEGNGVRQTWTKKAMSQALKERGLNYGKLTGGVRGFKDLVLVPDPGSYARFSRGY